MGRETRRWVQGSLAVLAMSATAAADPPPKVCVVVAGDPDENVRAAAQSLADTIGLHPALRGVADPDARAALRGERPTPDGMTEFATARRELHGTDHDADALAPVARALGCALVVELASRPAAMMLRVYDVVHQTWQEAHDMPSIDSTAVDTWIVPIAHPPTTLVLGTAPPAPAAGTTEPAVTPAVRPPATAAVTAPPSRGFFARYWPWFAAGAVVVGLFAAFAIVQGQTVSSTPVSVSVVHPGMP